LKVSDWVLEPPDEIVLILAHDFFRLRTLNSLAHSGDSKTAWLRLFEIARVLVRVDHVASIIINADHSIV
jgi:hypothetical protein